MIQPVQPVSKDYDLDNGQPYDVKTGGNVDLDLKGFGEILRKESEENVD